MTKPYQDAVRARICERLTAVLTPEINKLPSITSNSVS